jgi:heat shock protein HslJ
MHFTSSSVRGFDGCNWFHYGAMRSPRRILKIGGGLVTTQGCGGVADATEQVFGDALDSVRRYVRQGRTLSLLSASGATLIVLRRIGRGLPKVGR